MYDYLIYFLIFSILGWCAEVVFCYFKTGRFVNRGLLRGPYCPIYGVGVCLSWAMLGEVENLGALFFLSAAVATLVEFAVGLVCEMMLGRRLWSYDGEVGNILGLVCPRFSLLWGFLLLVALESMPLISRLARTLDGAPYRTLVFVALSVITADGVTSVIDQIKKNREERTV